MERLTRALSPLALCALPLLAGGCNESHGRTPPMPMVVEPAAPSTNADEEPPSAPTAKAARACAPLLVDLPTIATLPNEPSSPDGAGGKPIPPIEYGAGAPRAAMAPFYERVARLLRGKAKDHVRMVVYGDSNGTRDFMTGQMRRVLQKKYGDGGHGFVTFGKPWRWHDFMDIKVESWTEAWAGFTVTSHPAFDGFHGHALIAAHSMQGGAKTWLQTSGPEAPIGHAASRFDFFYMKGPRFGTFEVTIDGESKGMLEGTQPTNEAGFSLIKVPDGPHKMEILAKSRLPVRILGAAVERDTPSLIVDGVGVGMLNCDTMLRDDPAVNKATLARRKYDLIVFHLGTLSNPTAYAECQAKVVARHRDALPGVPILIMSSPDFLDNQYPVRSAAWVVKVRDEQRKFARENGLAFFDFHGAMGGVTSFAWFEANKMSIQDGVHFNEAGGAYMGDRVVYALWRDLAGYLESNPEAGCGEDDREMP